MSAALDSDDHAALRQWMRRIDVKATGPRMDASFCREVCLHAPFEAMVYLRARLREVMPDRATQPHPDTRQEKRA